MGISQEELAGRADLHRTYIADIERGARNPSLLSIEKLARALHIPLASLFQSLSATGFLPRDGNPVELLVIEGEQEEVQQLLRNSMITNAVRGFRNVDALMHELPAETGDEPDQPNGKLVVVDLRRSGAGGMETLRQLKADRRTRGLPVVALVGDAQTDEQAEFARWGIAECLRNPLEIRELAAMTTRLNLNWTLVRRSN